MEAAAGGNIGTQTAGTPFNIKITARDAFNATVTGFTGTVDLTSTGTLSAGGGTTASFTAGVLASTSVTISNTGSFTITATNTAGAEAGTSNAFTVNAAPVTNFLVQGTAGGTWYNAAWLYRKKITIDNTKVGSGGVTNFPVLVSLTTDTDLQTKALASGNDILFTSTDGTTKLSHEIETYVSGTGQLIAWVKVLSISSAATTDFYMYYGNAAAASQQDAVNVWDTNFKGVWHTKETAGGAGAIKDSTTNANNGTDTNGAVVGAAGKVNKAVTFDGTNDYVTMGAAASLQIVGDLTLSAWVNYAALDATAYSNTLIISGVSGSNYQYWFSIDGPSKKPQIYWNNFLFLSSVAATFNATEWHILSTTRDATAKSLKFYVDGVQLGTTTAYATNASGSGTTSFGADNAVPATYNLQGSMGEVRISNMVRPAAWLLTEYNSQNSPSTFYSVAAETWSDIGPQTAGTAFTIKVTARDAGGNTVTSFTGTVDLTSTGILSAGGGTTASFTAGVLSSTSVTISNAGLFTMTATKTSSTETGTSNAFTVTATAGVLTNFLVQAVAGGGHLVGCELRASAANYRDDHHRRHERLLGEGQRQSHCLDRRRRAGERQRRSHRLLQQLQRQHGMGRARSAAGRRHHLYRYVSQLVVQASGEHRGQRHGHQLLHLLHLSFGGRAADQRDERLSVLRQFPRQFRRHDDQVDGFRHRHRVWRRHDRRLRRRRHRQRVREGKLCVRCRYAVGSQHEILRHARQRYDVSGCNGLSRLFR